MFPLGHLAVGYVGYTIFSRVVYRVPPAGAAVIALAIGTQFPDLIDKPLYYWFEALPSGRSLGHSLVFAVPGSLLALVVGRQIGRQREALAFGFGWLSHLPADSYGAILSGNYGEASFLLWPFYPAYEGTATSFGFHLEHHVPELEAIVREPIGVLLLTSFGHEILAATFVMLLWAVDGFPGPKALWRGSVGRVWTVGGSERRDVG